MTKGDIELIVDFLHQNGILVGRNNGCSNCIYDSECGNDYSRVYSCVDGITEYIFKEINK